MTRKIWAFIGFNIYAIFLLWAFQENTGSLFEADAINEMQLYDMNIDPRSWGWGVHYIWRLISGCIVTALVGMLCGAIAKEKGGKVAAISNIPSVIIWGILIFIAFFTEIELEAKTGYIIISFIAMPLTTYIAYISGKHGEEIQYNEFEENTIFGIWPYHLIWAVFPVYWYALGMIGPIVTYIRVAWDNIGFIGIILLPLAFIPVLVWFLPLLAVYMILAGEWFSNKGKLFKAVLNVAILAVGLLVASGVQFGCYWLLEKIF